MRAASRDTRCCLMAIALQQFKAASTTPAQEDARPASLRMWRKMTLKPPSGYASALSKTASSTVPRGVFHASLAFELSGEHAAKYSPTVLSMT